MKAPLSFGGICCFLFLLKGTIEASGSRLLPGIDGKNGHIDDYALRGKTDQGEVDSKGLDLVAERRPKINPSRQRRAAGYGEDEGLDEKDYIFIGVGSFTVLVISLSICLYCCCKSKQNRTKLENEPEDPGETHAGGTALTASIHLENDSNGSTAKGSTAAEESQKLLTDKNLPNDKPAEAERLPEVSSGEDEGQLRLPIPKGQLANVLQKLASTEDGYNTEFEALAANDIASVDHSQIDANKPKNRFKNILPYDHSLVVLNEGDPYINASFITGYGGREKAYIATQGPLDSTREAFWRMVWQEGCSEIVMLANLLENKKKKCAKYWPDEGKAAAHGSITVHNRGEVTETLQYTVRKFELEKEGVDEKRLVRQYHFTAWGDMSDINSATPIWEILKQLREERVKPEEEAGKHLPPIVVHCSAGCGRTGTVITLDVMRITMKRDNQVDIFNFVNQMRSERMNMVQVLTQYRFIYESVLIYMRLKRTCFPPDQFVEKLGEWEVPPSESTMSTLQKQYHLYKYLHPAMKKAEYAGEKPENKDKNRDPSKLPDDIQRPLLQTQVPDDDTSTNYINACFFNGYTKRSRFLATQAPMLTTYTDLWRMVFDYKVQTIIGFQGDDRERFPVYWPSDSAELGPFTVENKGEEKVSDNLTIRDFELEKVSEGADKNPKNTRSVKQYCISGFDEMAPDQQVALLVDLITKRVRPGLEGDPESRVTVQCEFGTGLSGVVIALCNAIDMLSTEGQVDVFTVVKQLRMSRHDIVDSFDTYKLLNDAVKYHIQNPPPEPPEEEEEPVYANMT